MQNVKQNAMHWNGDRSSFMVYGSREDLEYYREMYESYTVEYYDDLIVGMASPSRRHSLVAKNILLLLEFHVGKEGNCRVFTESVCFVDDRFYPDASIACNPDKNWEGALEPKLFVEVLSPSNVTKAGTYQYNSLFIKKLTQYFVCGVPMVWVVNMEQESVRVYTALTEYTEYAGDDKMPLIDKEVRLFFDI